MRSIGLDLGARNIAYCEVRGGKVVERATVRSLTELRSRLGPDSGHARIAFEACREGWYVHDKLTEWGHEPHMLDTTRIRQIGVGQHKRKNDAIDAEAIAHAVERGRLPEAHVLSPARRALREQLSIRGALVETRTQYVTTIRGLLRARGVLLPTCRTDHFVEKLESVAMESAPRALIAPLVGMLRALEKELVLAEEGLLVLAEQEPMLKLCATVPGVGLIVAATFVSVIDDARRFKNAHSVGAYLGLVPGESTTGGQRRLGGITKQGNGHARSMLIQSAWLILRSRAMSGDPLKAWADNLVKTRGKKVAVVALARKLAGVLWAMCRDGTLYDASMQAKQSARGIELASQVIAARADQLERAAKKLRPRATSALARDARKKPTPAASRKVSSDRPEVAT